MNPSLPFPFCPRASRALSAGPAGPAGSGFYLYKYGLRMCSDLTTPSYLSVSDWLAGGWLGKRDLGGCFYHPPWQLLGWRPGSEGLLLRLALAGPAGDLKNALLRRCLGFYVAYCA